MLSWVRREWGFVAALLAFVGFWLLVLDGALASFAPQIQNAAQNTAAEGNQSHPLADAWDWLTKDSVSFFTAIIAAFTGLLGVVAVKADKTARRQIGLVEKQQELQTRQHFLTHRPHLEVRNIRLRKDGIESLSKLISR
jgi:hypothetical protein